MSRPLTPWHGASMKIALPRRGPAHHIYIYDIRMEMKVLLLLTLNIFFPISFRVAPRYAKKPYISVHGNFVHFLCHRRHRFMFGFYASFEPP